MNLLRTLLLVTIMLLCASFVGACTDDIFEPDGSCIITNTFLIDGETQTHNFCNDAEDWIQFNGCTGTSFTVETSNLGLNCNTYLEIYDTDCTTLLASDDDSGTGLGSLISWAAPGNGTYHIRVTSVGSLTGDDHEYDITLTGDTSPCSLWFVDYDEFASNPREGVLQDTPEGGSIYLTYTGTQPQFDPRVLKLDREGRVEWEKSFSIDDWDTSSEILVTSDGGYLFVGTSSDGSVDDKDWHVVKLDAAGAVSWHRVMGSASSDNARTVVEDPGTGYIIAGNSGSFGVGNGDAWVVKLSTGGAIIWQMAYGHTGGEIFLTVERETGGNLIFAGSTSSFGAVNTDGWIVKTDSAGTILWDRRYGSNEVDIFYSVIPTQDGGYITAGRTGFSNPEGWLVKIDSAGAIQWEKSYGSSYFDIFTSVIQTHEGGYIAAGTITTVTTPHEHTWIVKMDVSGNVEWQKRYTASVDMRAQSIIQMPDEGYLISTDKGMVLRIDSLGNTGAGCSYSTDTAISPAATAFGSVVTTSAAVNSTATVSIPAITTPASSAVIEDACPCPDAAASIDSILPSSSECAGVELTLTGSGSGLGSLTHEWDFDYDGITFDVDDSGVSVTQTYNPASDTVYTVALRVSDSCTSGPATAIDTTTVTVWKPALSITGPSGICRGDSALLDAGAGFSSYFWSPGGQITQTISVSPYLDTTYSVDVTDSNGCIATGNHLLAVWWNPAPTITEYGECGDIILDAGEGYDTYLWSPGSETTQTINIGSDTTTTYSVTVTNTHACPGSDTHQASSSCPGDPYEPDDSCADGAMVLHGGDLQTHNFCDDAEDWFMFNASASRTYTIETSSLCPSADTIIELYDTDCTTLLTFDDNGGTGSASKLDWISPGHGTYHIRVLNSGGSNGPDLGYDIGLTGDTSPYRLWIKTFDITDVPRGDRIYWQEQTPDGGFIVAGETINQGTFDYDPWLFKLDSLGNIEWEQRYIADIYSATVHSAPGGFYYLTNIDGTVMKLDNTGSAVWQKQIDCSLRSACLTDDDGLVIAGYVNNDFYAARLDAAGTIIWQKTCGGGGDDRARHISPTLDGGFILAGYAGSFGTSSEHMWIVRLDGSGSIVWQRAYGADVGASASSIYPADDGGFIVGGYTWFSGGFFDHLVIKLTEDGHIEWQKVLPDASSQDSAGSVLQSHDGSYIVKGGVSPSAGNSYFRVSKMDRDGTVLWQNVYMDIDYLNISHLIENVDGGLTLGGFTDAFGADLQAGLMFKTDMNGLVGSSCSIIASEPFSYVDPLLESIVTAAVPANANRTVANVAISSTAVTATVVEPCSTCLKAAALITDVSPSSAVCDGTELTFTGTGYGQGGLTYQWDFDYDGITFDIMDTGSSTTYTYPADGSYTSAFRMIDSCPDPGAQNDIDTIDITIHPLPAPAISGLSGICLGDPPVVLDAGAGYASYLWSPGGAITQTISVSPGTTTLYSVTVTTAAGCQGTDDHTLNVYPVPSPTITEYCFGSDIILDAGDGFATYLWSPGGETTQTINVGSDTATSYSVTVTLTGGCEGTDNHTAAGPCSASGDIYEEDDTSHASDTVIDGGASQSHNFLDDPEDWISFNACLDRAYTIETSNPGILTDTLLELYDTDGTTLLTSDDNGGGDGVSSLINWTAPASGLYHVRVTQADASWGVDRSYDITLVGDTTSCFAWARSFGHAFWDSGYGSVQSHDGGFMVAGVKQMGESEGDFWLFRLAGDGSTTWEKTYPGPNTDGAFSLDRTSDGSYVAAGLYQQFGSGPYDFQAMEITDAGAITWERVYGNSTSEEAYAVRETSDGGFIMAGKRNNNEGWILKLDASGNSSWHRQIGGSGRDYFNDIVETGDGGFLAAGFTDSYGDGAGDFFLVKLNDSGTMQWQKTYGGTGRDEAHALTETQDGGFIIAGETASYGAGGKDIWVLKLDMAGTLEWQKTYGAAGDGIAHSVALTRDGGYAVAGESDSFGGGDTDLWVLKLQSDGTVSWQKRYGDTGDDGANSIGQTADGGYIIAGYTLSYGAGNRDFWVLKTKADGSIDSSCTFISDTAVTAQDSSDSWGYPSAGVSYSNASSVTTTTPVDSSAATSEQCSFTACAPVTASIDSVVPTTTVCQGQQQTFNGSGTGDGSLTLEWDFDYDGVTFNVMDTGSPVNYTYPATGTFTAALRVTDSCPGGAQELIDTILITIPDPSPVITGPAAICEGESAQLDAGAGFVSYLWSPGGATTQTINVSPAVTTLYSVTVADGDGCEGTDNHNLVVNPNPTPSITGPAAYCLGDPAITLDAGAGYVTYLWSPGGQTTRMIDVTPAVTTLYSVTVTDGNSCQGTDDHLVTVSAIPPIPQDFTVTAECGQIALSWTDGPDETLYRIERDAGSGFVLLTTLPADSSGHNDTGVSDGTSYIYRVRAESTCGNSSYTAELSSVTATAIYSAATISADSEYCNALVFTWLDTYALEDGYIIERDIDSSGSWTAIDLIPADSTFYADHDVSEGFDYSYRIIVKNICGNSTASNSITMTPDCTLSGGACLNPSVTSVGENISSAPNWVEPTSIAWNGTNFGVVWSDPRDAGEWKLIFALMDSSGTLVTGSEKVISSADLSGMPDIAWNGSQFAVVASGDVGYLGNGEQIYFLTLDASGNPTSAVIDLSSAPDYGNNFNPRVHWNGSTWGVVWDSWAWGDEEVLFQRLDVLGVPQHATPLWLSSSGPGLYSGNPDITSLGGEWFAVWEEEDGSDTEIHYSRRNADGTAVSTAPLTSDSNFNFYGRIAANDSVIGLTYIQNSSSYFRAFNPDGSWATSLQLLSTFSGVEATDISSTGTEWAVVWQDSVSFPFPVPPNIFYQRIDNSGTKTGSLLNVVGNSWTTVGPRIDWASDRWGISYTENSSSGNSDAFGAIVECGSVAASPTTPGDPAVREFCSLLAVHWIDTSPNEDNFILERSVDGGVFTLLATLDPDVYFYLDLDVSPSSTYSYRVKATNTTGDSGYTAESAATSPFDCPIEDIAIESVTYNPDGTITFVWTDLEWQEYVDVYRGDLDGAFDIYDTIVDCDYDADTGTYTTTISQAGATDFFYYIAPRTSDGNLFGFDSSGGERTPIGPLCP